MKRMSGTLNGCRTSRAVNHRRKLLVSAVAALMLPMAVGATLLNAKDITKVEKFQDREYVKVANKWYHKVSEKRAFEVMPDVVTVKLKSDAKEKKAAFLKEHKKIRENKLGFVDIKVPEGMDPLEFAKLLQQRTDVEVAEVNTIGEYTLIPDDTDFGDQWDLDNTGQTGGTADADIDAPEAWDIAIGDGSVVVGVLDSGTEYDHEDLECNIWVNPGEDLDGDGAVGDFLDDENGVDDDSNGFIDDLMGWDFGSGDNDPAPIDNSHGTHVAGIVAACGGNAQGVIGIGGGFGAGTGVLMMPVAVGNAAPDGSVLDDAIIYATDNGAWVITMSLSVGSSAAIDAALDYAHDTMGVFINNASGNDTAAVGYPATHPDVMAVGSTDHNDDRAGTSNFGPELEIVAPGVTILSTIRGDAYDYMSGTSMASPHVAGTAALMLSVAPAATNEEVRTCLQNTAEDQVGNPAQDTFGPDDYYGFGRLNAADALVCIAPNFPPVCDANGPYTAECGLGTALDGTGSSDPDDDPLTFAWTGPFTPSPASSATPTVVFPSPTGNKTVMLAVDDGIAVPQQCTADVTVQDTMPPSLTAPADVTAECQSPDGTSVSLGKATVSDACDTSVEVSNDAPAVFPLGTTTVVWTAKDGDNNSSSADQSVTVEDSLVPVIACNSPATIVPPDAPISFIASAVDQCEGSITPQLVAYDCFAYTKKGMRIDKTESCVVVLNGHTVSILDSGGVNTTIAWTVSATDSSGNTATENCSVAVIKP